VEFTEAENTCKLNEATMISIHSSDENLFVLRTSNNQFGEFTVFYSAIWIGAMRSSPRDNFKWNNGKIFNFNSWDNFEPAPNSQDDVNYVKMTFTSFWQTDAKMDRKRYPFICEIDSMNE
jgi:hypothetical protein